MEGNLKMSPRTRTPKAIDLRPFSAVARRHAKASHSVGTFGMSEGYELVRVCYDDRIAIVYHVAHHGSSFGAPVREDSIVRGKAVLAAIETDLVAQGYLVSWQTDSLHSLRLMVVVR